jgi:hypothetical protein
VQGIRYGVQGSELSVNLSSYTLCLAPRSVLYAPCSMFTQWNFHTVKYIYHSTGALCPEPFTFYFYLFTPHLELEVKYEIYEKSNH